MDSAYRPADAGIASGLVVAAISRYRPKQTQYTQPMARLPHKRSGSPPSGNATDTALM